MKQQNAPQTPEQLLASYAATAQNRAMQAVLGRQIKALRDQLETCDASQLPKLQGGISAHKALLRLVTGVPE